MVEVVEELGPTVEAEEEAKLGHFTQNQILDGREPGILTYLLSTHAGATGIGGSLLTRVWSQPRVHGEDL